MAKTDGGPTLADYVTIAASPVLIMALVGSLVLFLVEVLYVGQYLQQLTTVLCLFVFAAVLIARISMQAGIAERAALYGSALGLAVWLALQQFVEYPAGSFAESWGWAINLGLIGLTWWSAHRLTWDCTLIDENVDASGTGLLREAGLEGAEPTRNPTEAPRSRKRPKQSSWWERFQNYRAERRKQPQAPGVWVVYFSLAALPLFGLGQAVIPPDEAARRQHAFWLMTVYVGSALGLLLTTSFLGLRRYLRQRRLHMPAAMTATWMMLGAGMIAGLLVLGALLPRPAPEYALWKLPWRAGARDLDASRRALPGDESGKGKGDPRGQLSEKDGKDTAKSARTRKDARDATTKGPDGAKGTGGRTPDAGRTERGKTDRAKDRSEKGQSKKDRGASKERGTSAKTRPETDAQGEPAPPAEPPAPTSAWFAQLAQLLKWIVLAGFALLVALLLLRALLSFLANFTGWARTLLDAWNAFWHGIRARLARGADQEGMAPTPRPPRSFRSFADPFLTGAAEGMSTKELLGYSFEALEAWARERGLARQPGETPLEFAARLGDEIPALEESARRLVLHYSRAAYAGREPPEGFDDDLRELWTVLAATARPQPAAQPP